MLQGIPHSLQLFNHVQNQNLRRFPVSHEHAGSIRLFTSQDHLSSDLGEAGVAIAIATVEIRRIICSFIFWMWWTAFLEGLIVIMGWMKFNEKNLSWS